MKKLKLIRKIIRILQTNPRTDYFNPKMKALEISRYFRLLKETSQTYQLLLESTVINAEKCNLYSGYIEFSVKWGQIDQAVVLLQ